MSFVPERGDLIWLDFDPQMGREQGGRRPALVLSPADYNRRVGLCLVCPVTNQSKGYPFEVPLPQDTLATGVILVDHLKSHDWRARRGSFIGKLNQEDEAWQDVLDLLEALLPLVVPEGNE